MRLLHFGRQRAVRILVEQNTTDGILLSKSQIGKRHRCRASVVVFRHGSVAEPHTLRSVEQKSEPQIGIHLILFDIEAILFCPDFPIDASGIVAGNVLSMLPKFDGIAEVSGLVHSAQKTVHDVLCPKVESRNPFERFWMKIVRKHLESMRILHGTAIIA